jgi:phage antirepressor YoqD-like protein
MVPQFDGIAVVERDGLQLISAVGAALDVTDKRIIFEASAAAAEIRSGEYLQEFDVGERRPLDWLVHHSFWSRGEGKSMHPTRAEIPLSRVTCSQT